MALAIVIIQGELNCWKSVCTSGDINCREEYNQVELIHYYIMQFSLDLPPMIIPDFQ